MRVCPGRDVARGIGQTHLDPRLGSSSVHGLDGYVLPNANAGHLVDLDAQASELEGVEETVNGSHIGRSARQVCGANLQVHVSQEAVETPVAHDIVHVLAQRSAALAADLIRAGQKVIQAVVLVDPLGGGLGADAGNTRQIV